MGDGSGLAWVAGADRVEAAESIISEFRRLRESRVIVVDAPAGMGRTFLCELVYRRFAAGSSYWPEELPAGELNFRHLDIPANASLDQLWLAVSGDAAAGHPLHQLAGQIDAHARTIRRVVTASRDRAAKVAYWAGQAAQFGMTVASGLSPGLALPPALDLLLQLALGLDFRGRASAGFVKSESLASAAAINAGWTVYPGETGDLAASVDQVSEGLNLVSQALPVLLVVDDAEQLDWQTVQMLKTVVRESHAITIVVATSLAVTKDPLRNWLKAPKTAAKRLGLSSLPYLELAELAAASVPEMHLRGRSVLARVLVAAAGQPGLLGDLLAAPVIRQHLISGHAFAGDMASLIRTGPDDAQQADFDPGVQATLHHLSVLGVTTMRSWAISTGVTPSEMQAAAATGHVVISGERIRFRSSRSHHAARRGRSRSKTVTEDAALLQDYRAAVARAHLDQTWSQIVTDVRLEALEVLCRPPEKDGVWEAELLDLRRQSGQITDLNDPYLEQVLTRMRTFGVGHSQLMRAAATTLAGLGQRERALVIYKTELDRIRGRHPEPHPTHIPALEGLARVNLAIAGDTDDDTVASRCLEAAISQLRQVLSLQEPLLRNLQLSDSDQYTAKLERSTVTRWVLAESLAKLRLYDGVEGAINQAAITVADLHSLGRANHEDTLSKRLSEVVWTQEAGHFRDSLRLATVLEPDVRRVTGTQSDLLLAVRHTLGSITGFAGDAAAARNLLEGLLPDNLAYFGNDHRNTLAIRHDLAVWTGEAGDAAAARDLLQALLPDQMRILGADDPDTLRTRRNFASWTGRAGDVVPARDLFAALVPECHRILGPDHPQTLSTRNSHAIWTGRDDDPEGARVLFEALVTDCHRVLGADHPDTLGARYNFAVWTGNAGDPAAARDLLQELLPDSVNAFGADHPNTEATRDSLAFWTR